MHHCTLRYSAACTTRRTALRLADASRPCTRGPLALRLPTRMYTAIPLNKVFLSPGARPQLAGNKEASHSTAPGLSDVSFDATAAANGTCASPAVQNALKKQNHFQNFMQCRPTSRAPALVPAASAVVEGLRVCESVRPAARMACVRVPRLLIFGGDVVSVTALEALHARMRCIVTEALRCSRRSTTGNNSDGDGYEKRQCCSSHVDSVNEISKEEAEAEVNAFVRDHITVVCPALPKGIGPEEAAKKFTRQYPVARYCVDHDLPIIPVDHPKSLARSTMLKEMLSTVQGTAAVPGAKLSSDTAVTSSLHAGQQPGSVSLTSYLPSHVFSGSLLVRSRLSACTTPTQAATRAATGMSRMPKEDEETAGGPAPHTWAAEGRPLGDYDLAVVVSFRYFLPQHLLRVLPPVINMHPSLLPRYRGASPIFSALRRNEAVGGVSIIQMKPEQKAMDSGSILWQCEVPITPDMDIRLYFPLVTQIGAAGLCDLIFGEAPASLVTKSLAASEATSEMTAATAFALHATPLVPPSVTAADLPTRSGAHVIDACPEATATARESNHSKSRAPESKVLTSGHRDAVGESNSVGSNGNKLQAAQCTPCDRETSSIPPWVALRRSSLMPVVHRSGCHASLPLLLCGRERLAPYVDRPELSALSPIITSQSGEADRAKGASGSCGSNGDDNEEAAGAFEGRFGGATNGGDSVPQPSRHWMTLCRNSTHITPEAVHAASKAHRALFFQSLESVSAASSSAGASGGKHKNTPVNKKQVSLAAAAEMEISTEMKCAEVFPKSVLSSHCDWPDSFTYSWRFAQLQEYRTFSHFTDDPFHAPLLPKNAAVLRFSAFTAMEAFGVWRAFVGGDYFQPSVNSTLDKGGSPVRNQLVHRGVRRLLRERARLQKSRASQPTPPPQRRQHHTEEAPATILMPTSEENEAPVGIVVGKHVELDVFNPAGLQLLVEAENLLRVTCTFTQVTNPTLVPACVQEELAEVERGGDRCCGWRPSAPLSDRRVRFYRPPPAIFRSLLTARANADDNAEERRGVQARKAAAAGRGAARERCGDAVDKAAVDDQEVRKQHGNRHDKKSAKQQQQQPGEPAEDEEAPEDYVPDVIHAAPPTEHRWHIPPGTGYFPESDESYGAIKCKEGWFLWREAHMKWANKAQPTVLIRKGLAMKTGVLYVGLFSEYS
ncbi:putative methionyl-tRNA formyltransferase [Leptomonas seymouri]|uniref:Putative methionyl-tRNA formyltransferase n=1 Tax=Leptomonas seymouri TaxID=5684 RepID=A0A0N1PCE1_LEPSE|nr:putative methionyl-tRNA formyltransferase [Leptomonas seymouri]|eukprot:KPI85304.1 putative methionyl-tRNA formyltransferase [Leptomonas seymouri]